MEVFQLSGPTGGATATAAFVTAGQVALVVVVSPGKLGNGAPPLDAMIDLCGDLVLFSEQHAVPLCQQHGDRLLIACQSLTATGAGAMTAAAFIDSIHPCVWTAAKTHRVLLVVQDCQLQITWPAANTNDVGRFAREYLGERGWDRNAGRWGMAPQIQRPANAVGSGYTGLLAADFKILDEALRDCDYAKPPDPEPVAGGSPQAQTPVRYVRLTGGSGYVEALLGSLDDLTPAVIGSANVLLLRGRDGVAERAAFVAWMATQIASLRCNRLSTPDEAVQPWVARTRKVDVAAASLAGFMRVVVVQEVAGAPTPAAGDLAKAAAEAWAQFDSEYRSVDLPLPPGGPGAKPDLMPLLRFRDGRRGTKQNLIGLLSASANDGAMGIGLSTPSYGWAELLEACVAAICTLIPAPLTAAPGSRPYAHLGNLIHEDVPSLLGPAGRLLLQRQPSVTDASPWSIGGAALHAVAGCCPCCMRFDKAEGLGACCQACVDHGSHDQSPHYRTARTFSELKDPPTGPAEDGLDDTLAAYRHRTGVSLPIRQADRTARRLLRVR